MIENRPTRQTAQAKDFDDEKIDRSFERLSEAFETSARRWELIVYPSLFGFILLAGYGFFLIFNLTRDIHFLAISVDSNMTVMASNFQVVTDDMNHLTANVRLMAGNMRDISDKIGTLEPMLTSINSMDQTMNSMDRAINSITHTTHNMRNDMANINQNVTRPMSFINTFMPW